MLVKKRMLITIVLFGGLTLLALGIAAVPSVLAIRDLEKKIAEEQDKIDVRYALRRYIRNSVTNLANTKRRIGALSAGALQEGKELEFITALEAAAEKSDVTQSITLETVNQKDTSKWEREIPLKLRIGGPYDRVLRHLNAIERLPYLVLLDSITISTPRQTSSAVPDGVIEATVDGVVYWQGTGAPDFVHGQAEDLPALDDEE
jgi:Tfp pilus assembly protein PilO